jgi:hypothetical protein
VFGIIGSSRCSRYLSGGPSSVGRTATLRIDTLIHMIDVSAARAQDGWS